MQNIELLQWQRSSEHPHDVIQCGERKIISMAVICKVVVARYFTVNQFLLFFKAANLSYLLRYIRIAQNKRHFETFPPIYEVLRKPLPSALPRKHLPCLLRKHMLQEIYETTRCRTKELDITRSKKFIIKKAKLCLNSFKITNIDISFLILWSRTANICQHHRLIDAWNYISAVEKLPKFLTKMHFIIVFIIQSCLERY